MLGDLNSIRLHNEQLKERQRFIAMERLAREAKHSKPGIARLYAPVLARVGMGLVTWGTTLQRRYDTAAQPRAYTITRNLR